jgi:hypothetical protein
VQRSNGLIGHLVPLLETAETIANERHRSQVTAAMVDEATERLRSKVVAPSVVDGDAPQREGTTGAKEQVAHLADATPKPDAAVAQSAHRLLPAIRRVGSRRSCEWLALQQSSAQQRRSSHSAWWRFGRSRSVLTKCGHTHRPLSSIGEPRIPGLTMRKYTFDWRRRSWCSRSGRGIGFRRSTRRRNTGAAGCAARGRR